MPDGRIICIAGEFEDFCDSDFCIYNDVIALRPAPGKESVDLESGEVEIYGYPRSVFAPTDFHSATLAGEHLYIIGRLGYMGTRTVGVTPIVTLNPSTYEIEQRVATGPAPGWIYAHHASFDEARAAERAITDTPCNQSTLSPDHEVLQPAAVSPSLNSPAPPHTCTSELRNSRT